MRFICLVLFLLFSCSEQSEFKGEVTIMEQSVNDNLKLIEKCRIFFGHMSVGFNIINGISDLMKKSGNKNINIIEISKNLNLPEYYFAHSKVGENTKPNTKCDTFSAILTNDFANKLDIALLKFCYVDMRAEDNPKSVFEYYKSTVDSIKIKYPNLTIVHITIPLTVIQTGWKAIIKKILGKEVGYKENINRYQFNKLLKEYFKDDPIFDLSKIESTYSDGSRESFEKDGKIYYALIPDYTYDGGHLNELGRQLAAKELLRILAENVRIIKN